MKVTNSPTSVSQPLGGVDPSMAQAPVATQTIVDAVQLDAVTDIRNAKSKLTGLPPTLSAEQIQAGASALAQFNTQYELSAEASSVSAKMS
jgi:hypothetical protein